MGKIDLTEQRFGTTQSLPEVSGSKLTAATLNARLTYLFGNEIQYLNKLGRELENGSVVVMLGVGPALMCLALLETAPEGVWFYGADHDPTVIHYAYQHVAAAKLPQVIIFEHKDTVAASYQALDDSVDLLLVDGDHSYEGVRRDIEAWWPKVRVGGTVLFHDYVKQEENNGVQEAIESYQDEHWEELDKPGVSIVFRKI